MWNINYMQPKKMAEKRKKKLIKIQLRIFERASERARTRGTFYTCETIIHWDRLSSTESRNEAKEAKVERYELLILSSQQRFNFFCDCVLICCWSCANAYQKKRAAKLYTATHHCTTNFCSSRRTIFRACQFFLPTTECKTKNEGAKWWDSAN